MRSNQAIPPRTSKHDDQLRELGVVGGCSRAELVGLATRRSRYAF